MGTNTWHGTLDKLIATKKGGLVRVTGTLSGATIAAAKLGAQQLLILPAANQCGVAAHYAGKVRFP